MPPLTRIQDLLATAPPHVVTAAVLIMAAALTLLIGLARRRAAFLWHVPGVAFIIAGAAAFWPLSIAGPWPRAQARAHSAAMAVAAGALVLHLLLQLRQRVEPRDAGFGSSRTSRVYLIAAVLIAAAQLFYQLSGYPALWVWEAPVVGGFPEIGGFAHVFQSRTGVWEYAAERFFWDDGVLSAGQTSLFYGAPTYALFQVAGFSPWTLRCLAAVAMLLSVVVMYLLARRFFGPITGGAAALLLALNHCALFYGRYGSSAAGTMLAVLLAVWCTWLFLDRDHSAWWMGAVCAASLYAATLQYSTARIVVVILLGFIPIVLAVRWRRLWWQRTVGAVVIAAAAYGVWHWQSTANTQDFFLHARGEHYLDMIQHPEYVKELFGKDLLIRQVRSDTITLADKLELLYRVIQTTWPQYATLMGPGIHTQPIGDGGDATVLPHLYYAPLVLFTVWGLVHSLWRWRSWPHACLLVWLSAGTVPLLLTNRVDAHRIMLFVIPLTLWAAVGVWEAARILHEAKMPRSLQHGIAGALALTMLYNNVTRLYYAPAVPPVPGSALAEEIAKIAAPVVLGALVDHRELAWAQLQMLERERRDPHWSGTLIAEPILHSGAEGGAGAEYLARDLERKLQTATVILAPADPFRVVATTLQGRGVRVSERGPTPFPMWRLNLGAAATGIPDEEVAPLPPIVVPPTPTPIPLEGGPQISVTMLKPTEVTFGFEPPQVNRTWGHSPIIMGGVRYQRGLGTHAWCRMTYTIPPNATAFQAIVGLSDEVRPNCLAAAVTFEVRDEKDTLLYDSGLVDASTPPAPIHVDLHGASAITLVVTEGGNGRDCDHANWASPAFLLESH